MTLYVILDIFAKSWPFGCLKCMDMSINTPMMYLNVMQGMWILSDYLNVMVLKDNGINQTSILWYSFYYIDKCWIVLKWSKQLL